MKKAQIVFEKLAAKGGWVSKGMAKLKNMVRGGEKATRGSKIVTNKAPEEIAKGMGAKGKDKITQVAREIKDNKLKFEAANKTTKRGKIKAERKYNKQDQKIHQSVISGNKADASKIDRNRAVNTMAGIGAVGLAGAGYSAKQSYDQRERAITALNNPRY